MPSSVFVTNGLKLGDSPSIDAFDRLRTSEAFTLFDSKQISDEHLGFFWDDQEISGSGTNSTYSKPRASTMLEVGTFTAGKRVRQTKQRFNYQPGKSQLILITGVIEQDGGGPGITGEVGLYDDNNGVFFRNDVNGWSVVRRSNIQFLFDNEVRQADWNLDKMDGTGPSRVNINPTRAQIFVIDFEWLGVGRVRMGFVIDGIIIYCHEFLHANDIQNVYMATPNLPIRYTLENDGTGIDSDLECICSTVISEGGFNPNGVLRQDGTKGAFINANVAGTYYALMGIRLKSDELTATILLESISQISSTADIAYWELRLNPTVAGTFTYSDVTNSYVQVAIGDTASNPSTNTVTGGTVLAGGYVSDTGTVNNITLNNSIKLGSLIDGTVDEIVLCVTPATGSSNLDIAGTMQWREIT